MAVLVLGRGTIRGISSEMFWLTKQLPSKPLFHYHMKLLFGEVLPLTGCVTLGKKLHLPLSHCILSLQNERSTQSNQADNYLQSQPLKGPRILPATLQSMAKANLDYLVHPYLQK